MKLFKKIVFDEAKNKKLKRERNISFEKIIKLIHEGKISHIYNHPNFLKYPEQQIYSFEIEDYIYLVPFIEDKDKIFLKTIFPSRKMTKILKKRGKKQ